MAVKSHSWGRQHFTRHWYDCLRALGIRQRGIYCTKDTFVTTALMAGVKMAWLEQPTGVNYVTLRKHYGRWMAGEVASELRQFAAVGATLFGRSAPQLFPQAVGSREQFPQAFEIASVRNWSQGDSNLVASPKTHVFSMRTTAAYPPFQP